MTCVLPVSQLPAGRECGWTAPQDGAGFKGDYRTDELSQHCRR